MWINQAEMKAMLEACLEKMEANPEEMRSVAEHQKVPDEEAAVEMIEATEDRTKDHDIPAWCHGVRAAVIKNQRSRRETKGHRMQQWNKGLWCKTAAMSEKEEDIRQDLQ
jgi:hypothetical protein